VAGLVLAFLSSRHCIQADAIIDKTLSDDLLDDDSIPDAPFPAPIYNSEEFQKESNDDKVSSDSPELSNDAGDDVATESTSTDSTVPSTDDTDPTLDGPEVDDSSEYTSASSAVKEENLMVDTTANDDTEEASPVPESDEEEEESTLTTDPKDTDASQQAKKESPLDFNSSDTADEDPPKVPSSSSKEEDDDDATYIDLDDESDQKTASTDDDVALTAKPTQPENETEATIQDALKYDKEKQEEDSTEIVDAMEEASVDVSSEETAEMNTEVPSDQGAEAVAGDSDDSGLLNDRTQSETKESSDDEILDSKTQSETKEGAKTVADDSDDDEILDDETQSETKESSDDEILDDKTQRKTRQSETKQSEFKESSDESAAAEAKSTQPTEPKAGSLASFFQQVNSEPDKKVDSSTIGVKKTPSITMTPPAKIKKYESKAREEILEGDVPVPYCGVWGVFRWERKRADLSTLFLLFQDLFMGDPNDPDRNASQMDMADMASLMTDEIMRQGQQAMLETPDVSDEAPPGAAKPKSVNNEFVEGLDDIDKLFEGVDPPDELDVGAGGSSIQEVIMGQGRRILVKRISVGIQLVRKTALQVKDKVTVRLKNKGFKFTMPEKEEAIEGAKQAGKWAWATAQQLFETAKGILDDMLEGEDLPVEDDLEEEEAEFMRQWRKSEG